MRKLIEKHPSWVKLELGKRADFRVRLWGRQSLIENQAGNNAQTCPGIRVAFPPLPRLVEITPSAAEKACPRGLRSMKRGMVVKELNKI